MKRILLSSPVWELGTALVGNWRTGILANSLVRHLVVLLLVKLIVLIALWAAFFQHPVDRHLTAQEIGRALVTSDAVTGRKTP